MNVINVMHQLNLLYLRGSNKFLFGYVLLQVVWNDSDVTRMCVNYGGKHVSAHALFDPVLCFDPS